MLTGRWRCFIIISPLSKCQSVCVCGHSPLPLSPLSPLVPISVSLHYPSSTLPPHPESWVIKHEMRLQTNSVCFRAVFSYPSQCCISLYFPFLPSFLSLSLSHFPFGFSIWIQSVFVSFASHPVSLRRTLWANIHYRWAQWSWLHIQSTYCNHSWVNTSYPFSACVCVCVWYTASSDFIEALILFNIFSTVI